MLGLNDAGEGGGGGYDVTQLFETSDNILQKRQIPKDKKSNCKATMRGDRQNHARRPCRPVTHLLPH